MNSSHATFIIVKYYVEVIQCLRNRHPNNIELENMSKLYHIQKLGLMNVSSMAAKLGTLNCDVDEFRVP